MSGTGGTGQDKQKYLLDNQYACLNPKPVYNTNTFVSFLFLYDINMHQKPAVESRKQPFQLIKARVQQNMSSYTQAMNTLWYPADFGYNHKEPGHLTEGCYDYTTQNQFLWY